MSDFSLNFSPAKVDRYKIQTFSLEETKFTLRQFPRSHEVTEIDYFLLYCKLNKFSFQIKLSSDNKIERFQKNISQKEIYARSICTHPKNTFSYKDFLTISEYLFKNEMKEEFLYSILCKIKENFKKSSLLKAGQIKNIHFDILNGIVLHSLNMVDIMFAGIHEYVGINKEIRSNYLEITLFERSKIFSITKMNWNSLQDFAVFLYNNHSNLNEKLILNNHQFLHLKKTLRNEIGRCRNFTQFFSETYKSKMENLIHQHSSKSGIIKQHCLKLKDLIVEISSQNKELPIFK
jgi:hypothetical protein